MMILTLATLLAAADPAPMPTTTPPRTVAGKLAEVTHAGKQALLEAADGQVRLTIDRNTMVFLEARLGTVQDLAAGLPVRASVGPAGEAYWIELRPKGVMPAERAGETSSGPTTNTAAAPLATPPATTLTTPAGTPAPASPPSGTKQP